VTIFPARVVGVIPSSLASRCGLRAGDALLTINGFPLRDVIDVQVYSGEPELSLHYERDGVERRCMKKRRYGEPLGLEFATVLFNEKIRTCQNNCDFCFVSQMAPGLRASLYIKDDDYRLSFLYGNYITLANLREEDWHRIAEQFLSPLYISVHVTDPDVRVNLMRNPWAARIMEHLTRLKQMGIAMHTQAVLVPGINDGHYLDRTISDLSSLYPAVLDLSVVPVGLTRWHHPQLRTYTKTEIMSVLEQLMQWRERFHDQLGISFVHPADEWFLQAGVTPPDVETYDGQLPVLAENGVGMVRRFMESFPDLMTALKYIGKKSQTWVTGTLFAQTLAQFADKFTRETGTAVNIVPVTNHAFGETVTVAGLLTVTDIINALRLTTLGDQIVLPDEIFRGSQGKSLDEQTASTLACEVGRSIILASYENKEWKLQGCTSTLGK
jgi:putative radical SAM enzyme (TIGR03279 family)